MTTEAAPLAAISDDELAALALAGDPDQPLDPDAVPFGADRDGLDLLPDWYMPAPMAVTARPTRRVVIALVIGALLLVNGAGLCVTYGFPEVAW